MYRVGGKPLTKGDEYAMKRPRSRRVPWHGLLFVVDELFQFFARLEIGNLLGRHVHFFTGLGVTSLARLPLTDTKATEAAGLNLVAPVLSIDDALEDGVHDDLGMLLGKVRDPGNLFYQFGFSHRPRLLNLGYVSEKP